VSQVSSVLSFEQHVLRGLLPTECDHDYNLRPRPHDLSLSCTVDHRNFIHRLAFKTLINTQDPSEIIVSIQHPVTVHSSVIDIGRYFFNLIYTSMWYGVIVPTLEFIYLYIYSTLTSFAVVSPSHFILALRQSCVLSTVVLINEYLSI